MPAFRPSSVRYPAGLAAAGSSCSNFMTGPCPLREFRYHCGMMTRDFFSTPRILVADDVRELADVSCFLLSGAGFREAATHQGLVWRSFLFER